MVTVEWFLPALILTKSLLLCFLCFVQLRRDRAALANTWANQVNIWQWSKYSFISLTYSKNLPLVALHLIIVWCLSLVPQCFMHWYLPITFGPFPAPVGGFPLTTRLLLRLRHLFCQHQPGFSASLSRILTLIVGLRSCSLFVSFTYHDYPVASNFFPVIH